MHVRSQCYFNNLKIETYFFRIDILLTYFIYILFNSTKLIDEGISRRLLTNAISIITSLEVNL